MSQTVQGSLAASARSALAGLVHVARALRPQRTPPPDDAPSTSETITELSEIGPLVLAPVDKSDLAELLVLQRCCWVQEALANDSMQIPPLHENADDVANWATTWRVWCVRRHGRLVAAVRARTENTSWMIGRLMVAPDLAGHGLGRWLLRHAERQAPDSTTSYSLVAGRRSHRNIALYERAGYRITGEPIHEPGTADALRLTKPRHPAAR